MSGGLILAREVKVDIRRLVSVKSKERFKGDIVTFSYVFSAALGALFRRKVIARADRTVGYELAVFAVGSMIVGRQRVYLRDT